MAVLCWGRSVTFSGTLLCLKNILTVEPVMSFQKASGFFKFITCLFSKLVADFSCYAGLALVHSAFLLLGTAFLPLLCLHYAFLSRLDTTVIFGNLGCRFGGTCSGFPEVAFVLFWLFCHHVQVVKSDCLKSFHPSFQRGGWAVLDFLLPQVFMPVVCVCVCFEDPRSLFF